MAVCAGEPSASGLQENDYPVLSDDRIGLAALKEIGSCKRLPLPAELAERFACILLCSSSRSNIWLHNNVVIIASQDHTLLDALMACRVIRILYFAETFHLRSEALQ